MMTMRPILLSAALLFSTSAFAKISIPSGTDALKHVVASAQFGKHAQTVPAGYELASVAVDSSGANAFKLTFHYAPKKGPGGACDIVAETKMETHTTGGLTSSSLSDPVVQAPNCKIGG
jgi:hypothetical protein